MKLLTIAVLATGVTLTVGPVTGLLAQTDSAARPAVAAQETGSDAGLQDWLTAFRARALAAGIDGAVFDRAMQTVRYDTEVIRRDRNQSEFTKTIWDYLETATSDLRIANGKKALAEQADALAQIEKRYGVEKEIITAIWGLESAYGTFRGSDPVLTSL
ncbi:MAG: lytic murein transglycosylase, partial [Sulfitobacter sp.]